MTLLSLVKTKAMQIGKQRCKDRTQPHLMNVENCSVEAMAQMNFLYLKITDLNHRSEWSCVCNYRYPRRL